MSEQLRQVRLLKQSRTTSTLLSEQIATFLVFHLNDTLFTTK